MGLAKRQTRHTGFPDCVSFELGYRHAVHVTFPQAEHRPPLVSAKRKPHAWHVHGTILVSGVIPYDSPLPHNDQRQQRLSGRLLDAAVRWLMGTVRTHR